MTILDPQTGEVHDPSAMATDDLIALAAHADAMLGAWRDAHRAATAALNDRRALASKAVEGERWLAACTERANWTRATEDVIAGLLDAGTISDVDAEACLPTRPKPHGTQLAALAGRLRRAGAHDEADALEACRTVSRKWTFREGSA